MQNTTRMVLDPIIQENSMSQQQAQVIVPTIRKIIKTYVQNSGLESLVLGVSGGLDSAIIAALCQEKYIGVPLIGISIPMSSSTEHKEQAEWVGNEYCNAFEEFREYDNEVYNDPQIYGSTKSPFYDNFFNTLEKTDRIASKAGFEVKNFPKNILQGNMKARIRMITLYDLARKTNGMVLSTDNYSELLMGFWTINGDVGDYGPIQNLFKGLELPAIARELGIREDIITQDPSDGLMVTEDNTDEAQLGASYKYVDAIMMAYFGRNDEYVEEWSQIQNDEVVEGIVGRYNGTQYKRLGTINLTREEIGA